MAKEKTAANVEQRRNTSKNQHLPQIRGKIVPRLMRGMIDVESVEI